MELYLLRHGPAYSHGHPDYSEDERPLTEEGVKLTQKVVKGMKDLGIDIKVILSSPLKRAMETAQIVSEKYDIKIEVCEALATGNNMELFNLLSEYVDMGPVCLVGHQPYMGLLISELVWGEPDVEIPLKKSGLARIDVDTYSGRPEGDLKFLLQAKHLAKLGEK